jgi:hypothetical protein
LRAGRQKVVAVGYPQLPALSNSRVVEPLVFNQSALLHAEGFAVVDTLPAVYRSRASGVFTGVATTLSRSFYF